MSPFERGEEPELRSAERGYSPETGRAQNRTALGIGEDVQQCCLWRRAGNLMRLSLEALECERDGKNWGFVFKPESNILFHLVLWGFESALIPKEAILKLEMRKGRWKGGREGKRGVKGE